MKHRNITELGEVIRRRVDIRQIAAIVFVLLFASAGVVFLLTSRAAPTGSASVPAVSLKCDPGVNAAEYWVMNGSEYHALQAQPSLHTAVKAASLFYSVSGGKSTSPVGGSQTLATYTSFATFSRDISHKALQPTIHWVMYDNERWSATPSDEQQQPLLYEQKFAALAHAHSYKVILAPAQDLLPGFSSVAFQDGTSYAQAFVTYFASTTAKNADMWNIQAQPYEMTNYRASNAYANLVASASAAARAVNPKIVLFTGVSSDHVTTASDLYQDWNSVRALVAGFWFETAQSQQASAVALAGQFFGILPTVVGSQGKTCTAAKSSSTASSSTKPYWLIDDQAIASLQNAGASSALIKTAFSNGQTYITSDVPDTNLPTKATQTATYTSYQAISDAFANGTLPGSYKAVIYNIENGPLTPLAEQQDPSGYERLIANLLHTHGLRFIAAPALDVVSASGSAVNGSVYDAYISRNVAGAAAKYADVVAIQAQGSELDVPQYASFITQATQQARQVNPHVVVVAGISTNPNGVQVSAQQLNDAYNAAKDVVDGYWLQIPGQSTVCPDCGSSQPQNAYHLLQQLYHLH